MDFEPFLMGLLGSLIGTGMTAYLFYRLRYRILRASVRDLKKAAPEEVKELVLGIFCEWEDKKGSDGVVVRSYKPSPFLLGFFESVLPVVVEIAWKSFGNKLGNLPVGPDGKMNFLAPVMKRLMDGKKISFQDFMPFLVEKIAPVIQGFVGGLTGSGAKGPEGGQAQSPAAVPKLGGPPS